jgi:hypothetical protein
VSNAVRQFPHSNSHQHNQHLIITHPDDPFGADEQPDGKIKKKKGSPKTKKKSKNADKEQEKEQDADATKEKDKDSKDSDSAKNLSSSDSPDKDKGSDEDDKKLNTESDKNSDKDDKNNQQLAIIPSSKVKDVKGTKTNDESGSPAVDKKACLKRTRQLAKEIIQEMELLDLCDSVRIAVEELNMERY